MKNLFIDTNIVIDVIANRKPFSEAGAKLFHYAENRKIHLFISALSYSNIYYILRKLISHKEMLKTLKNIEFFTETIDVTKQVISNSLNSDFKDFEDAIQYYTASSNKKIDTIVTRNGKDYKARHIPILTPEEVLSIIESESANG